MKRMLMAGAAGLFMLLGLVWGAGADMAWRTPNPNPARLGVHKAFHPHWWTSAPYRCWESNGWWSCDAGGWEPAGLALSGAGGSIPLIGDVFTNGRVAGVGIKTAGFKPRSLSIACQSSPMQTQRKGKVDPRNLRYLYEGMPASGSLDDCLADPLIVTIDGWRYRLDSSRLRRALEKARDRFDAPLGADSAGYATQRDHGDKANVDGGVGGGDGGVGAFGDSFF